MQRVRVGGVLFVEGVGVRARAKASLATVLLLGVAPCWWRSEHDLADGAGLGGDRTGVLAVGEAHLRRGRARAELARNRAGGAVGDWFTRWAVSRPGRAGI